PSASCSGPALVGKKIAPRQCGGRWTHCSGNAQSTVARLPPRPPPEGAAVDPPLDEDGRGAAAETEPPPREGAGAGAAPALPLAPRAGAALPRDAGVAPLLAARPACLPVDGDAAAAPAPVE